MKNPWTRLEQVKPRRIFPKRLEVATAKGIDIGLGCFNKKLLISLEGRY